MRGDGFDFILHGVHVPHGWGGDFPSLGMRTNVTYTELWSHPFLRTRRAVNARAARAAIVRQRGPTRASMGDPPGWRKTL